MAKRRANNEGTIYKKKDGKWRAQISLDGRRLSFTAQTQRECQAWLKDLRNQIDKGLTYKSSGVELAQYLNDWINGSSGFRARSTIRLYRWIIEKRIIPHIGHLNMRELKPDLIQGFYVHLQEKGASDHAVSHVHRVLSVALNQAVKLGLLGRNPCMAVTSPKPKQKIMQFFDEQQVQVFLNMARELGDRLYPMYYLAIHTGMRQAELMGLKWEDLNWGNRTIQVNRQVMHLAGDGYIFTKPKTKAGNRSIILGRQALEVLRDQQYEVAVMKDTAGEKWVGLDLIFPSSEGTPLTGYKIRRGFNEVITEAGLSRIRFHDLRHTAASLMLNHGIPVLIASKRLGHSKPSITMDVYGHMLPSKQEEAADLMDDLMGTAETSRCTRTAPD